MSEPTKQLPVVFPNGTQAKFEVTTTSQEVDFAEGLTYNLNQVFGAVEGLADAANLTLSKIRPKKAKLEVGLTTKLEAGTIAVFVKGGSEATMKITLE